MAMTQTLTEKAIDALACAGAALEKAEAMQKQANETKTRANAAIVPAVSALIKAGLYDETMRQDLVRALADPATALEALKKVAEYHAASVTTTKQAMGRGYPQADGNGEKRPRVLSDVPGGKLRPSDRVYYGLLGVEVPPDA
jgi:hypothetical protein